MVGSRALVGDGIDYEVSPRLGSLPGRGLYSGVNLSMYAVAMLAQGKQKATVGAQHRASPSPLPSARVRVRLQQVQETSQAD